MEDLQRIARDDDAKLAHKSSNAEPRVMFPTWLACPSLPLSPFWRLHGGPVPEITRGRGWAHAFSSSLDLAAISV